MILNANRYSIRFNCYPNIVNDDSLPRIATSYSTNKKIEIIIGRRKGEMKIHKMNACYNGIISINDPIVYNIIFIFFTTNY